ncbi:hypothetical protein PPERSA_01012 [Pseudocohnilembus persalinus]|uniref:Transmembrane protein n=1 Tax=Pseudocohnilembus persalinus TaxID=266149 RepID=A0A0V0QUP4_PSEPJ|nr:hypothetical protein PPERSA_01012 [Pseudocohnilembus persalinus]|eukprot:KRX05934.1 hypothetical protein PPERSA_01012 [Pseudocohnilembus persalinus]
MTTFTESQSNRQNTQNNHNNSERVQNVALNITSENQLHKTFKKAQTQQIQQTNLVQQYQPNLKGCLHFILVEQKNIIQLHFLLSFIIFVLLTFANISSLFFNFQFENFKGNTKNLVACIVNYSFSVPFTGNNNYICENVEFKMCENGKFAGHQNYGTNSSKCSFKEQGNLKYLNDNPLLQIFPCIIFYLVQIVMISAYVFLVRSYYKYGGAYKTGKYYQFTFQFQKRYNYHILLAVLFLIYMVVTVFLLVLVFNDIRMIYGHVLLVELFEIAYGAYLISSIYQKGIVAFDFNPENGFQGITFIKQKFYQTNKCHFEQFKTHLYKFLKKPTNSNLLKVNHYVQNKKQFQTLLNIFTKLYELKTLKKEMDKDSQNSNTETAHKQTLSPYLPYNHQNQEDNQQTRTNTIINKGSKTFKSINDQKRDVLSISPQQTQQSPNKNCWNTQTLEKAYRKGNFNNNNYNNNNQQSVSYLSDNRIQIQEDASYSNIQLNQNKNDEAVIDDDENTNSQTNNQQLDNQNRIENDSNIEGSPTQQSNRQQKSINHQVYQNQSDNNFNNNSLYVNKQYYKVQMKQQLQIKKDQNISPQFQISGGHSLSMKDLYISSQFKVPNDDVSGKSKLKNINNNFLLDRFNQSQTMKLSQ